MKTALIDADIFAYEVAAANEERIDWGDGQVSVTQKRELWECAEKLEENIEAVARKLKCDEIIVCLTHEIEFRKIILPSYKAHRDPSKKPAYLKQLKQHLLETYRSYKKPGLEADDCMGILSTHPTLVPGKKVIVSIDKDLRQIPGWLFNPDKDTKPRLIKAADGDRFHMMQTLTGDPVDGYKGCPNIGPKRAAAILEPNYCWSDVWDAFAGKGITFEDALTQARVARICRWQDYDYKKQEVILWNPPKGDVA